MARANSSTKVTHHFSRKPETSPLLTRGPASHGHFKCHCAGPGSAYLGKVCRHPALRNNSPDQKPLMYREHLRKKNVFYVKKKLKLCILYQQLCVKNGNQKSLIYLKLFLKKIFSWIFDIVLKQLHASKMGSDHVTKGPVPLELLPAAKACDGIHCYGFLIKIIKFLLITPAGLTVVTAVPSSAWDWFEFHKRSCQGGSQTWLHPEGSPRRSPSQGSFGDS